MLSETHLTDMDQEEEEPGKNPNLDFVYMGNRRVAVLTGTVNPGPSPCFVATAAYGTAMSADIGALRVFRDRLLKKISFGQKFIHWYYLKGPKYARWLQSHPGWKPIVRVGLVVPVAVSKVIFFGNVFVSLASFGLVLCGAVYVGRKRRWNTGRTLFVIFLLTFASVMIYSFIVEVPQSLASRATEDPKLQQEKVYFIYEDHIGRPVLMTEWRDYDSDDSYLDNGNGNGDPFWKAAYSPFGQLYNDFNSTGIDIGTYPNDINWLPPFRFPGQYADDILDETAFYNQWRFYMPEIGRYTSPDPMGQFGDIAIYRYAGNNPVIFIDPYGLNSLVDFFNYRSKLEYQKMQWQKQATDHYIDQTYRTIVNINIPYFQFTGRKECESFSDCFMRCWSEYMGHYAELGASISGSIYFVANTPIPKQLELIVVGGTPITTTINLPARYFVSNYLSEVFGLSIPLRSIALGAGYVAAGLAGWGVGTAAGCANNCLDRD